MFYLVRTNLAMLALLALVSQAGSCGMSSSRGSGNVAANTNVANADANRGASTNMDGGGGNRNVETGGVSRVAVEQGTWGGRSVRLDVEEEGAKIEFDCAHGSMGKLVTDAAGNFSVAGIFVRERGGPISIDDKEESQYARYSGKIEGKRMNLTVTITGAGEKIEPMSFTLTHGNEARLFKCL